MIVQAQRMSAGRYRDVMVEGEDGKKKEKLEEEEEYLARVAGALRLLGAFLVHYSIPEAWVWLAALLNCTHENRATATALQAFLSTAGYSLSQAYGRQFLKLLRCAARPPCPLAHALCACITLASLQVHRGVLAAHSGEGWPCKRGSLDADNVLQKRISATSSRQPAGAVCA
jgi:GLE1-like protein